MALLLLMLLLLLLLFLLLSLLFYVLLRAVLPAPNQPKISVGPWKKANLCQFLIFSLQNSTIVCLNYQYNWLVSFNCTDLSSDSLKKERLCLKIVLGQTGFELYCTVILFCWTQPFWVRIGSPCWRYRALQSPATAFFYIVYSCCIVKFPIVKMVFEFF